MNDPTAGPDADTPWGGIRRRLLAGMALSCLLGRGLAATPAAPEVDAEALQRASDAVVGLEVSVIEDAPSIDLLGRTREGSGVVIGDDGLVLTIGYLLIEADEADLLLDDGRRIPARIVGVDLASGLGLLQALVPLTVRPAPLGRTSAVAVDDSLLLVTGGRGGAVSVARLAARRAYSGYWEYHLDEALFTRPARTDHGGAGLFNRHGELLGIGSLLVLETPEEYEAGPGNMFVPVDLLAPIVGELRARGSARDSHRAWLGVHCREQPDGVRIVRVTRGSPAEAAGLDAGDVITRIDGMPIDRLERFYKSLWRGGAERDITLEVLRDGQRHEVRVHSVDRMDTLRRSRGI